MFFDYSMAHSTRYILPITVSTPNSISIIFSLLCLSMTNLLTVPPRNHVFMVLVSFMCLSFYLELLSMLSPTRLTPTYLLLLPVDVILSPVPQCWGKCFSYWFLSLPCILSPSMNHFILFWWCIINFLKAYSSLSS